MALRKYPHGIETAGRSESIVTGYGDSDRNILADLQDEWRDDDDWKCIACDEFHDDPCELSQPDRW